eukprot:6124573-Pyramimonas_sp.AAC.1
MRSAQRLQGPPAAVAPRVPHVEPARLVAPRVRLHPRLSLVPVLLIRHHADRPALSWPCHSPPFLNSTVALSGTSASLGPPFWL